MTQEQTPALSVVQADREAAWNYADFHCLPDSQMRDRWMTGYYDNLPQGHAIRAFAAHRATTRTPDPAVAGLVEAARRMLPSNLSLDNGQWPDSTSIPIDATLGELRALRDALATWSAQ